MAKRIVAIVSDLHTNSVVGLCPPYVEKYEGGSHTFSRVQSWLWDQWKQFWTEVRLHAIRTGWPVTAIVNGDIFDGDHHGTHQIISKSGITMSTIAEGVLEVPLSVVDDIFITKGTPVHEGELSERVEALAEEVEAVQSPNGDYSWWHLYAEFGGVTFDIMHHPESYSSRPWTAGAGANRIAVIVAMDYMKSGTQPPQVAIRSHKHGFRDSGKTHPTQVFVTPPWQLRTAFAERIGYGGKVQEVGGIIFLCDDGEYTPIVKQYRPKRMGPYKGDGDTDE